MFVALCILAHCNTVLAYWDTQIDFHSLTAIAIYSHLFFISVCLSSFKQTSNHNPNESLVTEIDFKMTLYKDILFGQCVMA